ncbi:MAG: response regulator [Chitinispirillaceae bacterium]|nr:response regulator [Chitinispirillaceae bacterium]
MAEPQRKPLILMVDDNPENLRLLGAILEQQGYSTAFAISGNEALHFINNELPDLILLDIMMPGEDGYAVCTRLKEMSATKMLPIIFLTARTETVDIVKGFTVGGVDYITKPFNQAELLARVKTHLDLKRAREEIKTLRGLLPTCAWCRRIRNENGEWESIEKYVQEHTEADFSHGMCPDCLTEKFPGIAERMQEKSR